MTKSAGNFYWCFYWSHLLQKSLMENFNFCAVFRQRLMLFSISNAFKKLNQRQQNLIHIVLNITIVFRSALHFPIFPTNWSKDNTFDPCYILRVLSKNIFCLFQTFIKWESRTKRFDAHFSFKTLNKFLTNPLIFLCFKCF